MGLSFSSDDVLSWPHCVIIMMIAPYDHDDTVDDPIRGQGQRKDNRCNLNHHKALLPPAIFPLDYRQMALIENHAL